MRSEKPRRRRGRAPHIVASLSALAWQGLTLLRAPHALRWRLETFGLYMPSLPEARPWWRVNLGALHAFARQLPGYARWLGEFASLRRRGPAGWWQTHATTRIEDWEAWLDESYNGRPDKEAESTGPVGAHRMGRLSGTLSESL